MSTIMPHGELTRRALTWIEENLSQHPEGQASKEHVAKLIEEASVRFNLSPLDGEFLLRTLLPKSGGEGEDGS